MNETLQAKDQSNQSRCEATSNPFEEHVRKPVYDGLTGAEYLARIERERKEETRIRDSVKVKPSGKRPHCLYCDKELRLYRWRGPTRPNKLYGTYGDNRFCGLTCGWNYAKRVTGG